MATELQIAATRLGQRPGPEAGAGDFDQLKGQFMASLNHELRTPLSGVIGMTDLLLETRLDDEQGEYVSTVRECAMQLLETLNSVLEYSALAAGNTRLEEGEFLPRTVIEGVVEEYRVRAEGKGLEVSCEFDAGFPEIAEGDGRHLRQALQHLLRNAVKFTPSGWVRLNSSVEQGPAPDRIWLRVDVADSGIGMSPAKTKLIFESFQQLDHGLARNYSGLGLGLALVQKIMLIMHGEVTVRSEPGRGSTFTLRAPMRLPGVGGGPQLVTAAGGATAQRKPGSNGRILVVEDNKIAQQVVGRILQRAGYEVVFADGGQAGIDRAAEMRYDLILMDLQMPGLDGLSATRSIRRLTGYDRVPVVALTANTTDEDRLMCEQCGMQGFLSKPVHKELLLHTISRLLPRRN